MEQLRQLGEVVGAIDALMAFEPELRVNPRQCRLLADACARALAAVTGEVRAHLRFEERGAKWRAVEPALRELHRAFRDAEGYVRQCLDPRGGGSWWGRAAAAAHCTDCVEQHLHGILWCVAIAVEAVEAAAEIAGHDADETARRRLVLANKYDSRSMLEPRLFQHAYGKLYLVSQELVARMDTVWKEDRWLLLQLLDEMKSPAAPKPLTKSEQRLADVLAAPRGKLHSASVLLNGDYSVRRRLGGNLKEAHWMGESFAVKHFIGDSEAEVSMLSSVAHPNVAHAAYCFHDEERKEYFVVMDQLMVKDLASYVKEMSSPRRRIPFPLVVAVDIMLQIARGMEHLHSKKIYHGELNPSNVLVKPRQPDGRQRRRRHLHLVRAGGSRASGEPRQAHREGGRVQLRDDLLRAADGQGPVRGQPPAGRQDEQEHPRRRAAAVPVPGAQVPGRPDEALLARRPGAAPAVRLRLPRPQVREAVPGHEPGAAAGPGRRSAGRAGR
uniref:Protein kinase domain-containing protein n=1 Tax=Zea mays TaxID=4577 RepID=A0A804QVV9_MAIZE